MAGNTGAEEGNTFSESLPDGALEEEFQELEETMGLSLPESFKAFYRIYNGQTDTDGVHCFLRNLMLPTVLPLTGFAKDKFFISNIINRHNKEGADDFYRNIVLPKAGYSEEKDQRVGEKGNAPASQEPGRLL